LEERQIPIRIITRSSNKDQINTLQRKYSSRNISVSFDVLKSQYVLVLQKAKVVVIPSLPSGRSNGQLVLLDSYALGKAVICTEGPHIWDYYGKDSVLTYKEKDSQDLLRQIDLLYTNPRLFRFLKEKSFEYLDHLGSKEDFVRQIFAETGLEWTK
jgi:glycosyltransferase involved in cell wall biosynthesis